MTATDIHSLLTRVERASGPDRELDNDLYYAFCAHATQQWTEWDSRHDFTHSLDTALALVRERFPDHDWAAGSDYENRRYWASLGGEAMGRLTGVGKTPALALLTGVGKTPALALLSALLTLIIAQQEEAHA